MEFSMCSKSLGFCFASSVEAPFDLAGASKPTFEIGTSTREINLREYYRFVIGKRFKIRLRYHFQKMVVRLSHNSQS
jgi:hypothetical protein